MKKIIIIAFTLLNVNLFADEVKVLSKRTLGLNKAGNDVSKNKKTASMVRNLITFLEASHFNVGAIGTVACIENENAKIMTSKKKCKALQKGLRLDLQSINNLQIQFNHPRGKKKLYNSKTTIAGLIFNDVKTSKNIESVGKNELILIKQLFLESYEKSELINFTLEK